MHWRAAALILTNEMAVPVARGDGCDLAYRALSEDYPDIADFDASVQRFQRPPAPACAPDGARFIATAP